MLPLRLLHVAIDLSIYGCAIASRDVAEMLERLRVDGTFGRVA